VVALLLLFASPFVLSEELNQLVMSFSCADDNNARCSGTQELVIDQWAALPPLRLEHSASYNSVHRTTLVVYSKSIDANDFSQRSIRAAVVGSDGTLVRAPFDIAPYATYPESKGAVRVVFNDDTGHWLVAFEYGTDEIHIAGCLIDGTTNALVGTVRALVNDTGTQQNQPALAYNTVTTHYALTFASMPPSTSGRTYLGVTFLHGSTLARLSSLEIDLALPFSTAAPTPTPPSPITADAGASSITVNPNVGSDAYIVAVESYRQTVSSMLLTVRESGFFEQTDQMGSLVFGNPPTQLSPVRPQLAWSSARLALAFESTIYPSDPVQNRPQVFVGYVTGAGVFNVSTLSRPFASVVGAASAQSSLAYSALLDRFVFAFQSWVLPAKTYGVGLGALFSDQQQTPVVSSSAANSGKVSERLMDQRRRKG
jgi:hypothetical protein